MTTQERHTICGCDDAKPCGSCLRDGYRPRVPMSGRKAEPGKRRIRFGRWGLMENPVGLCVTWRDNGRDMLGDVTECYLREGYAPTHMLKVRHFNGEDAGEVAASAVIVLEPVEADFTHAD